jgi:DNA-binding CsgD family transcriptional regulator
MINPLNQYVTVLQRFSYIPGNLPNMPAGIIGVAFDITHFKNDTSIIHTIEKVKEVDGIQINELLYKKIHPVENVNVLPISLREHQVLQHMAEGMSSKQIASTLFLSVHTVNNHRKNMLQKTSCKTSSELLNYALKHGHL